MTHKLLLADDSVTIQRVVELTFSGEDVHVVTVGDGEEAIARIPVERPDIVLADIGMPKRSGYDVAAFVKGRADLSHIPVLLLAGAFEPVDETRAQQVRSDGVLVKPFEPQQVISRVKDLIEGHKGGKHASAGTDQPSTTPVEPRSWNAGSKAQSPDPGLDDYFERLDAAFAKLAGEPERYPSPLSSNEADTDAQALPTVEGLLGTVPESRDTTSPEDAPAASAPSPLVPASIDPPGHGADGGVPHERPVTSGRNPVAEMFAALFAAEQEHAGAPPVRITPAPMPAAVATDELVDEVTRRVLERLAPAAANELVTQIVSDVAERLIREEIARIKSEAGSRL